MDKLLYYAGRLGIEIEGKFTDSRKAAERTPQRRKFTRNWVGEVSLRDFRLGFGEEAAGKIRAKRRIRKIHR